MLFDKFVFQNRQLRQYPTLPRKHHPLHSPPSFHYRTPVALVVWRSIALNANHSLPVDFFNKNAAVVKPPVVVPVKENNITRFRHGHNAPLFSEKRHGSLAPGKAICVPYISERSPGIVIHPRHEHTAPGQPIKAKPGTVLSTIRIHRLLTVTDLTFSNINYGKHHTFFNNISVGGGGDILLKNARMNFFSYMFGLYKSFKTQTRYTIGTQMQSVSSNGVTGQPDKIGTLYTCCKILSENLSRMPLSVWSDNEMGLTELRRHRLTWLLKHQPNGYQNAQQFWSTVEYHRSVYGNAFVRKHTAASGYTASLEIIHPGYLKEYYFSNGQLFYCFFNPEMTGTFDIPAFDVLHLKGMSEDGVIGLSPLVAIERQTNINERATATIDNFYKNNATSPMALETDLPGTLSGPGMGLLKDSKTFFEASYTGPDNAGKWIHLPIGTRLKSIAMQFADARLIETLRFTREDISSAYGIPLFMVDGSAEKLDVEQLTTLFKTNTMGPIVAIYMQEINSKMLTRNEIEQGFSAMFDVFSLVGMDYNSRVTAIKEQVVNGLMTPNEGARKLGNHPIQGDYGKKHYMQAQYIPLEDYGQYNPLMTNDPTLKTPRGRPRKQPFPNQLIIETTK